MSESGTGYCVPGGPTRTVMMSASWYCWCFTDDAYCRSRGYQQGGRSDEAELGAETQGCSQRRILVRLEAGIRGSRCHLRNRPPGRLTPGARSCRGASILLGLRQGEHYIEARRQARASGLDPTFHSRSTRTPRCRELHTAGAVTVQIRCVGIGHHGAAAGLLPLLPWREKAGMRGTPSPAVRPCQRLIDSEHLPGAPLG